MELAVFTTSMLLDIAYRITVTPHQGQEVDLFEILYQK